MASQEKKNTPAPPFKSITSSTVAATLQQVPINHPHKIRYKTIEVEQEETGGMFKSTLMSLTIIIGNECTRKN